MARVAITEQQVGRILAAPKTVIEDVHWEPKGHVHWVGCELAVENQVRITLHLHLNANLQDRTKYSFALIASRGHRIAGFDSGSSHVNRHSNNERWLGQAHKHRWTEVCRDSFAYTPADVDNTSVESAFVSFCKETGIEFQGKFAPVPAVQSTLNF